LEVVDDLFGVEMSLGSVTMCESLKGEKGCAARGFTLFVPPRGCPERMMHAYTSANMFEDARRVSDAIAAAAIRTRLPKLVALSSVGVTPLTPDHPIDFVMANHFTATHPSSQFRSKLMMRMFVGGDTVRLLDNQLTVDGISRELVDHGDLAAMLQQHFGIDLEVSQLRLLPDFRPSG